MIEAGHIAPGVVDERSIEDVHPSDLRGFTQCHFFAGVGVWSLALRRAGWPDDRPVWTGSCPCQPFSAAGLGAAFEDARHLWPSFAWLIKQCKPPVIFGEQVASKAVEPWIDLVHADVEAMEYAFGAVAFPSAGVGAPHIRDRVYWVANTNNRRHRSQIKTADPRQSKSDRPTDFACGYRLPPGRLANSDSDSGRRIAGSEGRQALGHRPSTESDRCIVGLDDADGQGSQGRPRNPESERSSPAVPAWNGRLADAGALRRNAGRHGHNRGDDRPEPGPDDQDAVPGPVNGQWADADWLFCRDGKWRPVEPGTFPLAHGAPARVGRLRAYGNAINLEAATEFVAAFLDI
ncbi:DNA cytosine methyltransferase [Pseudomonas proteolytica]|uniref:DNA cytosine methyltransferase n=1 Tax=Pseudomonas proteolytica TaxID=219574 RepID=UPI001F2B5483|nr:DNA cytosine methyltransferase [Pseudomonas proteolytica]